MVRRIDGGGASVDNRRIHLGLGFSLMENRRVGDCPCEIFEVPIDVLFAPDTVVQPDVVLVCDPGKLVNGKYVDGAPIWRLRWFPFDWTCGPAVEADLYERCGIRHYWLADPVMLTLEWYRMEAGAYGKPAVFGRGDEVTLPICGCLTLQLDDVFGPEPEVARRGPGW